MALHHRTCNLCEAMCGIVVEHDGGRVLGIRGDRDDPFSRGHVCPKVVALQDVHEDPDRLRTPLRRTASGWEPIGWDDAFDLAAARLAEIRERHGRRAVALYQGNPTVHNYGATLFGVQFSKALGSHNAFSATSVDQLPHMLAALEMFGHQLLLPIPDLDRTDHLLVLGANPVVSNGSIMTAPDVARRLRALRERGGKLVVVDPRRTETAEIADAHHFIRPGTDALLLLALLHVIFAERLDRPGRLAELVDGTEELREAVAPFAPERVASHVGIAPDAIRAMARDFALARTAACYGRVGVCLQPYGGLAAWLCYAMNVVTGNLDREGGVLFTRPAADLVAIGDLLGMRGSHGRHRSRVRGLPEFGGEMPVATLAEEIETPGEGQIRALVTHAGNPVLSTPNGRRLDAALASLDFMVSVDIYLNETTRHAHLILPPTFALEHDNYELAFHALAIRNTTKYSPALFSRSPDQRHDWEIFLELATRLQGRGGAARRFAAAAQRAVIRRVGPRGVLDLALRLGPHRLSLKQVERAPHGIDLGPLEPCLPGRLYTKDARIHLAPRVFLDDVPRARAALDEAPAELVLIGRRELRTNNSWVHNSERMTKGPERCHLLMHPDDARARSLADGQAVRVASRVATIGATLRVSDEVMPGVVSLPHGWGHGRPGVRLRVASQRPGVSVNDLTDEARVDPLSGTAGLNGVPVEVAAAGGDA